MMSMSGGWFFVVASEAFTVGNTQVMLPGIGSWLAVAIEHQNLGAVAWAVGAMAVVIVLYDQLLFRPVVAWADKFRFEQTASETSRSPGSIDCSAAHATVSAAGPAHCVSDVAGATAPPRPGRAARVSRCARRPCGLTGRGLSSWAWAPFGPVWTIVRYVTHSVSLHDVAIAFGLGLLTLLRVLVLIVVASLIWVPVGVWIGLRPAWSQRIQPVAQFLAAFPANVIFPFAVMGIVAGHLDPNIWLSPLIILGTQWYILFNVVAGASALPNDLKEAAGIFHLRAWQRWRDLILPGIFPYYVTGALTASGGSWNASIVAEVVSWGHTKLQAAGLGAFIANATAAGDFPRVALGASVMSVFVIALNRSVWRPMYAYAEKNLRLN